MIKNASAEINSIAQQRINQIIRQGGKEAEKILPKILGGAIEDVYQTPFRLLGKFGKQQLNKLKSKILREIFNLQIHYIYRNQTIISNLQIIYRISICLKKEIKIFFDSLIFLK